ncbi:MAG: phosphate ABC transporter substrate-binding protein [Methanobrevibacter sp.]|uniref:phosphate ABC transporter substrate-binding protein n=1 Tax=Methanobrevibacter sp. TaxID=66852 RepID=UPI0025CF1E78|nr:phosphate ABC transporter substrate-binding protein [Methanobrevibacter sp.]MBR0270757.1 phosphate ABC transporter substrate-binding protein [Methanobrevibacter sp.]
MKKKYIIFSLILALGLMVLIQGNANSEEINIIGSSSIQPVCEDLVEEYKKNRSETDITVQGGGSNMAIKCVDADIADIGMCSKELDNEYGFTEYELGREGIVVAVNPSNNISDLSAEELKCIFNGNITNWNQVGGENKSINVFVREEGSGTLDAFKTIVMNQTPILNDAIVFNSQGSIKQAIEQDTSSIGIVSLSYLDDDIKALGIDGIYPTEESIANGSYLLQRPFLLLIKDDPSNETLDFINWINSSDAEDILDENKIIRGV